MEPFPYLSWSWLSNINHPAAWDIPYNPLEITVKMFEN